MSDTSPHDFVPLAFWDRWTANGRCKVCTTKRMLHPTNRWEQARPIGFNKPAIFGRYPELDTATGPPEPEHD